MTRPPPRRYAVVGAAVTNSLSPAIHHHFARVTQKPVAYAALSVAEGGFADAVSEFWREGGSGVNVTVPFKPDAAALADRLSSMAKRCGVANVLQRGRDGRVAGFNTDGAGLLTDLQRVAGRSIAGARILVVGAGGAARGVLPTLVGKAPRLVVVANRTEERAGRLVDELRLSGDAEVRAVGYSSVPEGFDLVLNATSCGHQGEAPDIPGRVFREARLAYDMNYGPAAKPFLELAGRSGAARLSDGLGMLVEQAALSFSVWEHVRPSTACLVGLLREIAQ